MTKEKIEKLKNINAGLQISLDGNDDIVEFVAKGKNIYSSIMDRLKSLKDNNIRFNFNAVVGRHNLDGVDDFLKVLNEKQLKCRFTFFSAELNPKYREYTLSTQEKYDFIMKINTFNKRVGNKHIFMSLPPLLTPEFLPYTVNTSCGWARNIAGILSNGDVTVCSPASGIDYFVAGNIKKMGFIDIWNNSEVFNRLRKHKISDLKGVCAICPAVEVCGGGCRVLPFLKNNDETSAFTICQEFYEAMQTEN